MVYASHAGMLSGLGFNLSAVDIGHYAEAMRDRHGLSGATLEVLLIIQQAPSDSEGWHLVSVMEMADRTGRHRVTIYRSLRTLAERGFVVHEPARGWHAPHRFFINTK